MNAEFSVAGGELSKPAREPRLKAVRMLGDGPFKAVLEWDFFSVQAHG